MSESDSSSEESYKISFFSPLLVAEKIYDIIKGDNEITTEQILDDFDNYFASSGFEDQIKKFSIGFLKMMMMKQTRGGSNWKEMKKLRSTLKKKTEWEFLAAGNHLLKFCEPYFEGEQETQDPPSNSLNPNSGKREIPKSISLTPGNHLDSLRGDMPPSLTLAQDDIQYPSLRSNDTDVRMRQRIREEKELLVTLKKENTQLSSERETIQSKNTLVLKENEQLKAQNEKLKKEIEEFNETIIKQRQIKEELNNTCTEGLASLEKQFPGLLNP